MHPLVRVAEVDSEYQPIVAAEKKEGRVPGLRIEMIPDQEPERISLRTG